MNRAWIPAGALAGVSVAGLLALAPLTDSLDTQVTFKPSVQLSSTLRTPLRNSVPVSVDLSTVGTVKTAALKRGGRASKIETGADAGQVNVPITPNTSSTTGAKVVTKTVTPATPSESVIKPKKSSARPKSITGTTGVNGDSGLSGGSKTQTGTGEISNTPGN
jgi:hypothetical protein